MNSYMEAIEKKYVGHNIFRRYISWLRFRKFQTKIIKQSHSIGSLWMFADFIKIAERVYFYENTKSGDIYSSSSYTSGENGFHIKDPLERVEIHCKLYSDDQAIVFEVKRINGGSIVNEVRFQGGEWTYGKGHDYNEVLVDNIIGIVNNAIITVLDFCWKYKGNILRIDKPA